MKFSDAQKLVDEWIQQFKIKYFGPEWILAQGTEELGELSEAALNNDRLILRKELGDLLFTYCCMANSQEIKIETSLDPIIGNYDKNKTYLEMNIARGELARTLNIAYGPKTAKEGEVVKSIEECLSVVIQKTNEFASSYNINLNESVQLTIDKLYKRDQTRWERIDSE